MTYEAWRISYQSSEQAARAAYSGLQSTSTRLHEAAVACANAEAERDALRAELDALKRQEPYAFAVNFPESSRVELVHDLDEAYEDMIYEAYEVRKLYLAPGAQPAPSVPDGFSREDLEAVADGLDGYEKTVNVGNVTGEGDDHLESTTAYAARFIRTMLAATPETKP